MIVCRYDEAGSSYLEVEFNDQGRYRNFTATKSIRARHGVLGARGIALASEGEVGIAGSVLMYQSFDSLGMSADWQRDLGADEVAEALAIGFGFVAIATSNLTIRIFSEAGLQKFALTLPSPVVALVARSHYLAAFYHLGAPFGGSQNLGFSLWNVSKEAELVGERKCPISRNSTLVWAGFSSDECVLTTLDSTGIFRQLAGFDHSPIGAGGSTHSSLFGPSAPATLTSFKSDSPNWSGSWTVILDSSRHKMMNIQKFWPVSLTKDKVRWVPCVTLAPPTATEGAPVSPQAVEPAYSPQVLPRPVASSAALEAGLLNVEQQVGAFEEAHLRNKISYNYMKHRVIQETDAENGVDLDDSWRENPDLVAAQVELDKSILRIIQSSCETDRVDRALDCVNELFLRKSLAVAQQLATKTDQIPLAQAINVLLRREVASADRQKDRSLRSSHGHSFSFTTATQTGSLAGGRDDDYAAASPAKRTKLHDASTTHTNKTLSLYASDEVEEVSQQAPAEEKDEDDAVLEPALTGASDQMDVDSSPVPVINPFSKATKTGAAPASIFDTIKQMKTAPPPAPAPAPAEKKGRKPKAASAASKKRQQTLGDPEDTQAEGPAKDSTASDANKKKRKLFS